MYKGPPEVETTNTETEKKNNQGKHTKKKRHKPLG